MNDVPDNSPHLWWTKRLLLAVIALLILLTISRLLWGWYAHRQLQHELDLISASGEPVSADQIQWPLVADSDNAALIWKKAMAAINSIVETPDQSDLAYPDYPPYPPQWHRLLETGVAGNAPAIALAEQAAEVNPADWGVRPAPSFLSGFLPTLGGIRNLSNLLADAALQSHEHGNDREALHRIVTIRKLASCSESQPLLVTYLVAVGVEYSALNRLEVIAPDLAIENVPNTSTSSPASRQQAQKLIYDLLNDSTNDRAMHRALVFERIYQLNEIHEFAKAAPVLAPMFDLEAIRSLQSMRIVLTAVDTTSNEPASEKILNQLQIDPNSYGFSGRASRLSPASWSATAQPPRYSRIVSASMGNSWMSRLTDVEYRLCQERQFAAVSLAMRLYWLDHHTWPQSLNDLAPKYLPRVPIDPFSATGAPLGYLMGKTPSGADRPVMYGIDSESHRTDAPTVRDIPPTPMFDYSRTPWQFRDVSRWYPAPTTQSTQPSP